MKSLNILIAAVVLSGSVLAQEPASSPAGTLDGRQFASNATLGKGLIGLYAANEDEEIKEMPKEARIEPSQTNAALARHGRGLRTGGACLIASSALWIVGGAMIAASAPENTTTTNNGYYYETTTTKDQSQVMLGMTIGVVGGTASIIAGIAMVVTGHVRQHQAESSGSSIYLKPTPGGLSMVVNF
jgi:hypothetical protein